MTAEERIEQLELQVSQLSNTCTYLATLLFRTLDAPRFPDDADEASQILGLVAGRQEDQGNMYAAEMLAEIAAALERRG